MKRAFIFKNSKRYENVIFEAIYQVPANPKKDTLVNLRNLKNYYETVTARFDQLKEVTLGQFGEIVTGFPNYDYPNIQVTTNLHYTKNHESHEVVTNHVLGESFYYCKDCKCEVAKK